MNNNIVFTKKDLYISSKIKGSKSYEENADDLVSDLLFSFTRIIDQVGKQQ